MAPLLTRRAGLSLAMIVAASALAFAISLAPGNVAALIAKRIAGPGASVELVERVTDELGLNDPIQVR